MLAFIDKHFFLANIHIRTILIGTIIDLEEGIQRKNSAIEGLKEDLVQLERDGLLEIRRLRYVRVYSICYLIFLMRRAGFFSQ